MGERGVVWDSQHFSAVQFDSRGTIMSDIITIKNQTIRYESRVLIADVFVSGKWIWAMLGNDKVRLELYNPQDPKSGYIVTRLLSQSK